MTSAPEPLPSPRIGEAERNDAANLLQEHMSAGRLNPTEFDERIGKALSAKTQDDLHTLFTDLPGRRPGQELARTEPADAPAPAGRSGISPWLAPGVLVPIAVLIFIITDFQYWWLIPAAAVLASIVGKVSHDQSYRPHRRLAREERYRERHDRRRGDH